MIKAAGVYPNFDINGGQLLPFCVFGFGFRKYFRFARVKSLLAYCRKALRDLERAFSSDNERLSEVISKPNIQ